MKTVEETISGWSPEEKEKFKDLIVECSEREIMITTDSKELKKSLDNLCSELSKLTDELLGLQKGSQKVLDITLESMLRLSSNKKIPTA